MNISFILQKGKFLFYLIIICTFLVSCTENPDEVNPSVPPRESTDSVFVYNMYGIAQYNYDENGRIFEILTLDPTTLSPFITDTEKYVCQYAYGEDGCLSELTYFGKKFQIKEFDANGRPVLAVCDITEPVMTVNFTYNSNNTIIEEAFYENNELVFKSTFDELSKPITLFYSGVGELKFDYYPSEIYVNIKHLDATQLAPQIVLYFDELGYPRYCTENFESAVRTTTWSYNQNNVCEDTIIESTYDGYFYTEEYMIFHDNKGRISSINLYTPKADGTPTMSAKYEYKYDIDGNAKTQTDTFYSDNNVISKKIFYEFINGKRGKVTTDTYLNGAVDTKVLEERQYDANGRTVKFILSNYLADGTYSSGKIEEYQYTYNGNVAKRITYSFSESEKLDYIFSEEYEFNDIGLNSRATYKGYDKNNVLVEKEIDEFEYNENGKIINQTVYVFDANDSLVNKTVTDNVYADVGYIKSTTSTQYNAEDNVVFTLVNKYNSGGEITSTTTTRYDSEGNVISSTTN